LIVTDNNKHLTQKTAVLWDTWHWKQCIDTDYL